MNRHKRPVEAVLPTATRPQLVHIGRRRRIEHLSKHARVAEGTKPCGLPNETRDYQDITKGPGSSPKGVAYRNAIFQALLNTPMFVNFVRMHATRWYKPGSCPVYPSCLTCAMAQLAAYYWPREPVSEAWRVEHVAQCCKSLWELCQKTFWPRSTPRGRIGPANLEDEFYSDSFLLNLLKEMRSQLERSPSEYQTFEKMFAVHIVCRWKCNAKSCGWTSAPYKWESSLHLNLAVQRPQPKSRQTSVLIGIERALRAKINVTARRASTPYQEKCENCQRPIESFIDIVSLPEILIVVRDIEELLPTDEPDIPFRQELNMSGLASGPNNNLDPKGYELVSTVGENRYSPLVSRDCVFARAAKYPGDKWYCIMDETIQETEFDVIEKLQRSVVDGGLADGANMVWPICPEIFIYRLKDQDGRSALIDAFGPISPLNDNLVFRNALSRTVSDIFTQKVGKGLLKFKVRIAPADPGPEDHNTVEVDLKLSYEINGKHYGIVNNEQNFLAFQLKPLTSAGQDQIDVIWTPHTGRATDRTVRRQKGLLPENKIGTTQHSSGLLGQVNLPGFDDPFTMPKPGENPLREDEMDVDPDYVFGRFPKGPKKPPGGNNNGNNGGRNNWDKNKNNNNNSNNNNNNGDNQKYNNNRNGGNQNGNNGSWNGGRNDGRRGRGNRGRGGRNY